MNYLLTFIVNRSDTDVMLTIVLPQAQRDFLIGYKPHLDHENDTAPEDYVNHGTVCAMQGDRHNGSTSTDQERALRDDRPSHVPWLPMA